MGSISVSMRSLFYIASRFDLHVSPYILFMLFWPIFRVLHQLDHLDRVVVLFSIFKTHYISSSPHPRSAPRGLRHSYRKNRSRRCPGCEVDLGNSDIWTQKVQHTSIYNGLRTCIGHIYVIFIIYMLLDLHRTAKHNGNRVFGKIFLYKEYDRLCEIYHIWSIIIHKAYGCERQRTCDSRIFVRVVSWSKILIWHNDLQTWGLPGTI